MSHFCADGKTPCAMKDGHKGHHLNAERKASTRAAYRARNREKLRARQTEYRTKHPGQEANLKHAATGSTGVLLYEKQSGLCAFCFSPLVPGTGCVDHDHECSYIPRHHQNRKCEHCIRGLVCNSCNAKIAYLDFKVFWGGWLTDSERTYLMGRPLLSLEEVAA